MSLPAALAEALEPLAGAGVRRARRTGGGDINEAWHVELDDGRRAFVKTRAGAPAGEYATEAAGLAWLGDAGAIAVPEVIALHDPPDAQAPGPRLLALEWIDEGSLDAEGESALGAGLAALHRAGAPAFGSPPPGAARAEGGELPPLRIGPLQLPNDPAPDWPAFYAQRRLLPLVEQAARSGALSVGGARAVEAVCERIGDLAGPAEPPARLHGDLWSGNVLADATGRPWLVDPAAYGGHREVDLAMLRLFGAPGPRVLAAYQDAHPLADGHEERVALWQLFPLLVHAVLFGGGYGAGVEPAARRYL